jgi:diaminopimelate decarboxylase
VCNQKLLENKIMAKNIPYHLIPKDLSLTDETITHGAERFGTPLYIYDQSMLEKNWKELTNHLPDAVKVYYSVKANPSLAIIQTFAKLGANFEVASIGELKAVQRVGVSPSHIIFVGPGKTNYELQYAIEKQVNVIVSESPREVYNIQAFAQNLQQIARVALRINPGRGKGMLSMGGLTQFGMDRNSALDILQDSKLSNIEVVGIQGFLGTQLLDWKVIEEHSRLILNIADDLQQSSRKLFSFIDLGGGFGIPYHEADKPLNLFELHKTLTNLLDEYSHIYPTTETIAVESGRFLVGSSGIFVTRVLDIKGDQEQYFVVLDGGINAFGGYDRYAGSRPIPIRILDSKNNDKKTITLCGPLCTPLDRLAANVLMRLPKDRSLVVFYLAGAYGYSASPGLFLSHGYPCEVLANREKLTLIRPRISPDEFVLNQRFS